jgi:ribosomal protein L11 methylase PrmA
VPKKHQAEIAQAHRSLTLKGKARAVADKTKRDAGNAFGKGSHAAEKTAAKPRKKKTSKD